LVILSFDTATDVATACIRADGEVLAESATPGRSVGAQRLLDDVHGLLDHAGMPLEAVDVIVAGTGPGTFTGLRIGLATAHGLGFALGITPWGADCSGMLQSIFALHGIHLLRDAWQQATQGAAVDCSLEDARPADLLFFSDREDGHITHVAMAIGGSQAVHIALGRGGHCLESFSQPDDYTRALAGRFRFARRIVA